MILAFLLFPFVEVYLFYKFIQAYSFADLALYTLTAMVLGWAIMKLQGRQTFQQMQTQIMQGQTPNDKALHSAFVLLGGLLLFIPGILSDVFGVLCIMPISRHLLIAYFKKSIKKGLLKGNVRVFGNGFGMGTGGGTFRSGSFDPNHFRNMHRETSVERDAQVIDIEPISITHEKKD